MKFRLLGVLLLLAAVSWGEDTSPAQEGEGLTLRAALVRAEQENPELAAFPWEQKAAEARVMQARLRPNPELTIEVENLRIGGAPSDSSREHTLDLEFDGGLTLVPGLGRGRDTDRTGAWQGTEITLSLAQVVLLGGKRARRIAHAEQEVHAAGMGYELLRTQVLAGAAEAFVEALAAQEALGLAHTLIALARATEEKVGLQTEAGKAPPLEEKHIRIERLMAEQDARELEGELATARLALAAFWGADQADFGPLLGDLESLQELPPLTELQEQAMAHPEVQVWAAEVETYRALHALERALAVPDLTVGLGFRSTGVEERTRGSGWNLSTGGAGFSRSSSTGWGRSESLSIGLSIPLPLFDRNQGAILEAEYLQSKSKAEERAAAARVRNTIAQLHGALETARAGVRQLEQEILPLADEALSVAREMYQGGGLELLEVLEAERSVVEARQRRIALLAAWHQARVALESYLGAAVIPAS